MKMAWMIVELNSIMVGWCSTWMYLLLLIIFMEILRIKKLDKLTPRVDELWNLRLILHTTYLWNLLVLLEKLLYRVQVLMLLLRLDMVKWTHVKMVDLADALRRIPLGIHSFLFLQLKQQVSRIAVLVGFLWFPPVYPYVVLTVTQVTCLWLFYF